MKMTLLNNLRIILALTLFVTGCLPSALPRETKTEDIYPAFTPQALKAADFAREIEKLTLIIQNQTVSREKRSEAHRRLAILYLNPRNPERNFLKSIDELGEFVDSAPEKMDKAGAADWVTALKTGKELQDMRKKTTRLEKQLELLTEENQLLVNEKEGLEKTNSGLNKTIEKLKNLDLSLEKKRRTFR